MRCDRATTAIELREQYCADGVQQKICEYQDAAVQIIWIVHPHQRTVTVYTAD